MMIAAQFGFAAADGIGVCACDLSAELVLNSFSVPPNLPFVAASAS